MTRRIWFTPWSCARTFVQASVVASCCLGGGAARAGEVPFSTQPPISTGTPLARAVSAADVDGDGDLDALSASLTGSPLSGSFPGIAWHENLGLAGWATHTVALSSNGASDVEAADIDGDGDVDLVSSSALGNLGVAWHENVAGNGSKWAARTITDQGGGALSVTSADVDGDGDRDVLAGVAAGGTVAWYENTLGNGSAWVTRTITTAAPGGVSVVAADIDGDGDQDVLSASNDHKVAWHENTLGNGTAWLMRTITTNAGLVSNVLAADIDGDGDQDAIAASMDGDHVAWYENTAGNGSSWSWRPIATNLSNPSALAVGDVDGDGDLDAVTAPLGIEQVYWLENTAGNGASWTLHTVATVGLVNAIGLADIDGDGDPDVLSADGSYGRINWHRNELIHQTACFGPVRTIVAMANPSGASAADVDRDGDLDVFATSSTSNSDVTWHRNDAGGAAWTAFTVATNRPTYVANVADVDGDGDSDAFIGSNPNNSAAWLDNPGGGSGWSSHAIGTPGDFSLLTLVGADLDGDGDTDALVPRNHLDWQENLDGQGLLWLRHTIATIANAPGARPVDLDGDGDLDVLALEIASFGGPAPFHWHENLLGDASTWAVHTISVTDAFDAVAIDLDADGDLDVVASRLSYSAGLFWHENLSGDGTSWATHTLFPFFVLASMESSDVDGDGDQDLVGNGGAAGLVWLERTGPGVTFALRTLGTSSGLPSQITPADLDGDGAPDFLWATPTADAVLWNRNGRGQVVLDLLDQVPSTVSNNDVFPILRVTVTHGGRAGDSDLELARLGLLFEEEPGDPLTSAEANALVEELRIYRDANGNGIFEPGVDTLVASVPTLALTAGVQTVTFPDGDPNVQVAFGTPRAFFVVAQLTGNANQQVPHQFRVTHLATGPSATRAEDRNADIPLTIGCPSDFPSRLIIAVPVELMDFTIE